MVEPMTTTVPWPAWPTDNLGWLGEDDNVREGAPTTSLTIEELRAQGLLTERVTYPITFTRQCPDCAGRGLIRASCCRHDHPRECAGHVYPCTNPECVDGLMLVKGMVEVDEPPRVFQVIMEGRWWQSSPAPAPETAPGLSEGGTGTLGGAEGQVAQISAAERAEGKVGGGECAGGGGCA